MRDINRLVLAEDDRDLAHGMRRALETVGGYVVWITWSSMDVIKLLDQTHAAWLILDLELEDGYGGDLVSEVRRLWGDDVYIIVLSGFFDRYPEHELLGKGADTFLRKPYAPKSLISQIVQARARFEGKELRANKGMLLQIGNGILDLNKGAYVSVQGEEETFLSDSQLKLMRFLASARDEGGWSFVDRGALMLNLWAEDHADDPYTYANRLRQLKARTKSLLGHDPIQVYKGGHTSKWRLDPKVVNLL